MAWLRFARLSILACACSACTPEAVEVDPAPRGGGGGPGECAPVDSPRPNCTECLLEKCAAEVDACADNDCACRRFGDELGQFNCVLACSVLNPSSVDRCAQNCGFGSLREADPRTRALWNCMLAVPGGPPVCRMCLTPPP